MLLREYVKEVKSCYTNTNKKAVLYFYIQLVISLVLTFWHTPFGKFLSCDSNKMSVKNDTLKVYMLWNLTSLLCHMGIRPPPPPHTLFTGHKALKMVGWGCKGYKLWPSQPPNWKPEVFWVMCFPPSLKPQILFGLQVSIDVLPVALDGQTPY